MAILRVLGQLPIKRSGTYYINSHKNSNQINLLQILLRKLSSFSKLLRVHQQRIAMPVRWGFAGAGLICNDFAACLQYLGPEQHKIVSVASRFFHEAEELSKKYKIPVVHESYKQLADDPNVEIVYIGVIHPFHFPLSKMMLEHGKHVLCEKPMCMSANETKELVRLARKKDLFLMEGIWSRSFPIYKKLEEILSNGSLGDVVQVNATFGKFQMHVPRVVEKELGGSALLDVGIYISQIASLVFGRKKPVQVKAVGKCKEDGVDLCAAISLEYDNGAIASLNCTIRAVLNNNVYIAGTKGTIEIKEPFWCPESMSLPDNSEFESKLPKINHQFNYGNSEGLIYEATEVRRCLKNGLKESPNVPLDESITISEILEEVRQQIGGY